MKQFWENHINFNAFMLHQLGNGIQFPYRISITQSWQ